MVQLLKAGLRGHSPLTSARATATATQVARRAILGQPAPSELDTRVEHAMAQPVIHIHTIPVN